MGRRYSDEQISRAKAVDLEQYLVRRGETLKRVGSESKWIYRDSSGTHDSVTVKGGKWFDHKRQQGGDSIGFLQEFMGFTFREAVEELLSGERAMEISVNKREYPTMPQTKKDFIMPEKAANMRRLYAYLTKTRFISPNIITHFVRAGALYQEAEHNNIVFLGLDENGIARAGSKKSTHSSGGYKGTITGSETEYGFCHKGPGDTLFTFEAPIDMLSYLTIYPENWQAQSYIALDGLSRRAMFHFLENNPQVKEINVCIDHDEAGIEVYDKHRELLIEAGYSADSVKRVYPPYKDWNESLNAEHGVKPIPAQGHPKIEAYRDNVEKLCDFYANRAQSYGRQFAKYYTESGLQGVVNAVSLELEQYRHCVDFGKVTKLNSANAGEHLLRTANFCGMALAELSCEKSASSNRAAAYKSSIVGLYNDYKPYKDKGKLRNHCDELAQKLEAVKKTLISGCDTAATSQTLRDLADTCIRAHVYIQTKYETDLAQQESLLNSALPELQEDITEDELEGAFSMRME